MLGAHALGVNQGSAYISLTQNQLGAYNIIGDKYYLINEESTAGKLEFKTNAEVMQGYAGVRRKGYYVKGGSEIPVGLPQNVLEYVDFVKPYEAEVAGERSIPAAAVREASRRHAEYIQKAQELFLPFRRRRPTAAELTRLLKDREAARAMGERGRAVFEAQSGATSRTVKLLTGLVSKDQLNDMGEVTV